MKFVFPVWLLLLSGIASPGEVYHVDSLGGDDTHAGTRSDSAWKSLERVNTHIFKPGDKVLFKAGTRYSGQLKPQGSGALIQGKPVCIFIDQYGRGPLPRIDGEGKSKDTLLLRNVEYWEVQNLEITNQGTNRVPWRTGVNVVSDGFGVMHHIYLRKLFVHDVNGDLRKSHEGCGIFFESRGEKKSRFEDLIIEDCHLLRTDRNGICQRTISGSRSTGVVIRRNLLEDIGGDGIKPWGCDKPLVEYNVIKGGRMRCEDAAAGIWPWDCDDTLIQFNEVSGFKGTKDGQGFDSDYRCRRSVFQYNYSHDNEGGFFLICSPGNSYCEDTIIRYNVSQNDGINSARVFQFGGGVKNTLVHNNTIYIGPRQSLPLFSFNEWARGNAENTRVINNIFYVDGQVTYRWDKSRNNVFSNNVYYGNHIGRPNDAKGSTNRPPLLKPGGAAFGLASVKAYQLQSCPPWLKGSGIPAAGGRDFFGHPLPASGPLIIGAHEFSGR
jgi:hypothetical protein